MEIDKTLKKSFIGSTRYFAASQGLDINLPSIESTAEKFITQGYSEGLAFEMAFEKRSQQEGLI